MSKRRRNSIYSNKKSGNLSYVFNKQDLEKLYNYVNGVNDVIKLSVEDEIKELEKTTKHIVMKNLHKGHGVDKGIYKKHIVIVNLHESLGDVHFQVGANKGHHRLTHLLENGHRIKINGQFIGKRTREIKHIGPGQDYVDKTALNLCEKAIDKAFKKG